MHFDRFLILLTLLTLSACQPKIETITTTDEFNNKICFQQRASDKQKEGKYQRYYSNGVLAEEAEYKNDSLHGYRRYYYESGKLQSEEGFEHGLNHGTYKKYSEAGNLEIVQTFINGAMEGNSIRYYPNGQVMEEVMIVHNEENGPFKEYYENGHLKAEGSYIFVDDAAAEQGELREYDTTGVLVRIANCESGICRTKYKRE